MKLTVRSIFEASLAERQHPATSALESAVVRGKPGHAYLLTGRGDADKWLIARQLAAFLNCLSRSGGQETSCLVLAADAALNEVTFCQNCKWIKEDQHPQAILTLSGEGGGKTGKVAVEKARLLAGELSRMSQYFRVVVVPDAGQEIFHRPAANALLKTIEEPGPGCLFALFATHPEEVLPTILSRCQVIPVPKPAEAGLWLGEQECGAVGEVQGELSFGCGGMSESLDWWARLLDLAQEGYPLKTMIDIAVSKEIEQHKEAAERDPETCRYLCRLTDLSEECKKRIDHFVAPKAALEAFALSWHKLKVSN